MDEGCRFQGIFSFKYISSLCSCNSLFDYFPPLDAWVCLCTVKTDTNHMFNTLAITCLLSIAIATSASASMGITLFVVARILHSCRSSCDLCFYFMLVLLLCYIFVFFKSIFYVFLQNEIPRLVTHLGIITSILI